MQGFPSSQLTAVWTHPVDGLQLSVVQASESLHAPLLGAWSQLSVASLQESVVQAIPSLQSTGVPATHPLVGLQVSVPSQY